MKPDLISTSKFLSYVLRHRPDSIDLQLDGEGWADVEELIAKARQKRTPLNRELLEEVVRTNDKKRFAFSEDGKRIRASQGHSIEIDLNLEPVAPPEILYHGTASRFVDAIRREGLKRMNRQHVHLSADYQTAVTVGVRHGKVVVLQVRASAMGEEGIPFYRSANGVWLVDRVPSHHIIFPDENR